MTVNLDGLQAPYRQVLADLARGAVLLERFGLFETYHEAGGRVVPCGNKISAQALEDLLRVAPHITALRPELGGRALCIRSDHRHQYLDALQASMPLDSFAEEWDVCRDTLRMRIAA